MDPFVSTPAVTASAVWHELEIFLQVLQLADEHRDGCSPYVHVVINHTMHDLENAFVFVGMRYSGTVLISFRVIGLGAHAAFGVMRIVQGPVGNTATRHTVGEYIASISERIATHVPAVAEAGDADLRGIGIAIGDQPFHHRAVIFSFPIAKVVIHVVHAFLAEVSAGPVVHRNLYQAFFGIPLLVAAQAPGIHYGSGIGATVD